MTALYKRPSRDGWTTGSDQVQDGLRWSVCIENWTVKQKENEWWNVWDNMWGRHQFLLNPTHQQSFVLCKNGFWVSKTETSNFFSGFVINTHQRQFWQAQILYLSRRTLGRGLLSWCRGCTSESWSSPFSVSSESRQSSPRIHLKESDKQEALGSLFALI